MFGSGGSDRDEADNGRERDAGHDRLARGRLLLALDVLLTTRSVTRASRLLGVNPSGASRILGELRALLNDPLLIRSGRGLVPSPLAEELHPTLQKLAAAIHAVFERRPLPELAGERFDERWNAPLPHPVPPLATGEATPPARAGEAAPVPAPAQRLARTIALVGARGRMQGQRMSAAQAEDAMAVILRGEADPIQIGAFLALVQTRDMTASELAGFVLAARAEVRRHFKVPKSLATDLDWPCYISPKDQRPPWFFHAAQLVARAGYRVVLHGSSGGGAVAGRHRVIADALGVPVCATGAEVAAALDHQAIACIPLDDLSPQLFRLLGLHPLMNSRSPVHDLVPLLQPLPARACLLGISKPPYREIHRDAAMVLGMKRLSVIANTKDVAQLNPFRVTTIHRLVAGEPSDEIIPSIPEPPAGPRAPVTSLEHWRDVWTGAATDARAEHVILATAAAALQALSDAPRTSFAEARAQAETLWRTRHERPSRPPPHRKP